jgi:hypothetical protein
MCRLASFFFKPDPDNLEILVSKLDSHSKTEKALSLNKNLWREGHYLPDGEIECRVLDEDKMTMEECNNIVKTRFPSFVDFWNWALKESGNDAVFDGDLDLSNLTEIPDGFELPKEIGGYLDLWNLESLPDGFKLPKEIGRWLDLRSLESLPDGFKMPKKIGGWLDLSNLKSIPDGFELPKKIGGSLNLSNLQSIPDGFEMPEEIGGYLDLCSLESLPDGFEMPEVKDSIYISDNLRNEYNLNNPQKMI